MEKVIKKKTGIVYKVSPKTARVRIDRVVMDKKYKKQYKVSKYFLVDIPANIEPNAGDSVEITEIKPISKRKSWTISKIIEQAKTIK